jgi:hypothetical protein
LLVAQPHRPRLRDVLSGGSLTDATAQLQHLRAVVKVRLLQRDVRKARHEKVVRLDEQPAFIRDWGWWRTRWWWWWWAWRRWWRRLRQTESHITTRVTDVRRVLGRDAQRRGAACLHVVLGDSAWSTRDPILILRRVHSDLRQAVRRDEMGGLDCRVGEWVRECLWLLATYQHTRSRRTPRSTPLRCVSQHRVACRPRWRTGATERGTCSRRLSADTHANRAPGSVTWLHGQESGGSQRTQQSARANA